MAKPSKETPPAPIDLGPERLSDWWERAEPAPKEFPAEELEAIKGICATSLVNRSESTAWISDWYRSYCRDKDVDRCCLPIALPHLIDLGALAALAPPPLRRWSGDASVASLKALYSECYMKRHIWRLSQHPAIKFVRERVAPLASSRRDLGSERTLIERRLHNTLVARLFGLVFTWVMRTWFSIDHGGDPDAVKSAIRKCAGPPRILRGAIPTAQFLARMGQALQKARDYANVLAPLERLLLGARPTVPHAFHDYDPHLIHECLLSPDLEERDYLVEPLRRSPLVPVVPSRAAGDMVSIRRLRKTNRMEKLPEVIPEDLAVLRVENHGKHLLLEKLNHEGLHIPERDAYEIEVRRRTFLVSFFADIGPETRSAIGDKGGATTAGIHARRLIFECLRDLSAQVALPYAEMDLCVHLEPIAGEAKRRQGQRFTLAQLQERFGKGRYNDMVEMEKLVPGYFFPRHRVGGSPPELTSVVQDFAQRDYDLAIYVFLGPERTLPALLPYTPPTRRKREGVKDVVRLVRLGRWPDRVELARGEGFAQASYDPRYLLQTDQEFRHGLIEDVIGRRVVKLVEELQLDMAALEGAGSA